MKRFKDCILLCIKGQNPLELLQVVKAECESQGMTTEINTSFTEADTMSVYVDFEQFPASKLVLNAPEDKSGVAILNIVPQRKSGLTMLEIPTYNQILDAFREKVFNTIAKKSGNEIDENSEDYSIEDVIPNSYQKLNTWLSFYPLSHHPNDEHRWYDFLIALRKNEEYISTGVLREYIQEKMNWGDKVLSDLEIRFEDQMDLLEYYDERR